MTVQELIEQLTEIEGLDAVVIEKDKRCEGYEGEEIDFIDEDKLNLIVKDHKLRIDRVRRRKRRILIVEC